MNSQDKRIRQQSEPKPGSARALFAVDGDGNGPSVHDAGKQGLEAPRDCLSSSNGVIDGAWEGEEVVSTPKRKATARRLFESCPVSEIERYLQAAEAQAFVSLQRRKDLEVEAVRATGGGTHRWTQLKPGEDIECSVDETPPLDRKPVDYRGG